MAGERGGIEASIARAKARISEIKLQIIAIEQNAHTEAQRELTDVEAKLSEANDRPGAIGESPVSEPTSGRRSMARSTSFPSTRSAASSTLRNTGHART